MAVERFMVSMAEQFVAEMVQIMRKRGILAKSELIRLLVHEEFNRAIIPEKKEESKDG